MKTYSGLKEGLDPIEKIVAGLHTYTELGRKEFVIVIVRSLVNP